MLAVSGKLPAGQVAVAKVWTGCLPWRHLKRIESYFPETFVPEYKQKQAL